MAWGLSRAVALWQVRPLPSGVRTWGPAWTAARGTSLLLPWLPWVHWHVKYGGNFPFSWLNGLALQEIGSLGVFVCKGSDPVELFWCPHQVLVSVGYSLGVGGQASRVALAFPWLFTHGCIQSLVKQQIILARNRATQMCFPRTGGGWSCSLSCVVHRPKWKD